MKHNYRPDAKQAPAKSTGGSGMRCGFCGKSRREVRKMVRADTGATICDQCVTQAVREIAESDALSKGSPP